MKYKISLTVTQPPDIGKRKWGECVKAGLLREAQVWQRDFLPRHFTPEARVIYKHQPRKSKYLKNKERGGRRKVNGRWVTIQRGGQVDNVFSGDMEKLLRGSIVIKLFPSRATLTMSGPQYISMRPYKSGQPNKAAEIFRKTTDETAALTQVLRFETMRQYTAWKQPQKVKI